MVMKSNTFAQEMTELAIRLLEVSTQYKRPRMERIRRYRALYNNETRTQYRIRYNAPIPIFSGMIDTLQADYDDALIIKANATDPADWIAEQKANAAMEKESQSMHPDKMWQQKFRLAKQEMIFTGRGILKYSASNENGYSSRLSNTTYERFHFEPQGGIDSERHLFLGEEGIWLSEYDLEQGVENGIYDRDNVNYLKEAQLNELKAATTDYMREAEWARFAPLGLNPRSHELVSEKIFHFCEFVITKKGMRWYVLFEPLSGKWIRFDKYTNINTSGLYPWITFASHPDMENFASKGFADDLYPHAITIVDMANTDFEARIRKMSASKAYDQEMVVNPALLDEAMMGRDRLVPMDTKGGTRRLSEGVYEFKTPEVSGNIDTINWLEDKVQKHLGVTDLQQGGAQPTSKKVGVIYTEQANISKRLSYAAQPFVEAGQQLGLRVIAGLKDYLDEPLSIRILGENGYEWDFLKRIELNTKKDLEMSVSSQAKENKLNELAKANRKEALGMLANGSNPLVWQEYVARDIGGYTEAEIARLLDLKTNTSKESVSLTSQVIQDIMLGKTPEINYKADYYFIRKLHDFVYQNQNDKKVKKRYKEFISYIDQHMDIAERNERSKAQEDMRQNKNMGGGAMSTESPESSMLPPTAKNAPVIA